MKLVDPTDFELLEALRDGRNIAANIALEIDQDRAYLNTRLPELEAYGLVKKIGPAPNSGLYELNRRGQAALTHREEYQELDTQQFHQLVEKELND